MLLVQLAIVGLGFGGVLSWTWVFGLCWFMEVVAGVTAGMRRRALFGKEPLQ